MMKQTFLVFIAFVLFSGSPLLAQDNGKGENKEDTEEEVDLEDIDVDEEADTIDIDDIDVEDIQEDELGTRGSFPWEQFAVGGQIGNLQFGDVTSIAVSPELNYKLDNMFTVGLGGVYEYFNVKRSFDRRFGYVEIENGKQRNIGFRPYARVQPVSAFPIFAQFEYERLDQEQPFSIEFAENGYRYNTVEQKVNNYNAGLGFLNGPYYLSLLYNFNNKSNKDDFFDQAEEQVNRTYSDEERDRLYPHDAISFRAGLNIPLSSGDRSNKRKEKKKKKDRKDEIARFN